MDVFAPAYYLFELADGYHPSRVNEGTLSIECLWMLSRAVPKSVPGPGLARSTSAPDFCSHHLPSLHESSEMSDSRVTARNITRLARI